MKYLFSVFKELRKEDNFKRVKGELISPSNSKIHRSIYSSRYDHKYLNDKIERRLVYQLEPLFVIGQSLGLSPKTDMLETIWKKLLLKRAVATIIHQLKNSKTS